jgi:hypothetical protein
VYRGGSIPVRAGSRWSSRATVVTTAPTEAPSAPSPPAPDRSHPPSEPSEQQRYEAAARLEASDPDAALAGYRDLARGRSAWAGNALYAVARLAHERGDRDGARRAANDYLRRFPRGANVADARALLSRIREHR